MSPPPTDQNDSPRPQGAQPPSPPRTLSNPRMAAIKTAEVPKTGKERVKSVLADLALNAAAVGKELATDFKNSDQFFKYKALIIALWVTLSVTGFVVACPGSTRGGENTLEAKLTITQVAGDRVYSLKNLSEEPWTDIRVTANGSYMLAAPQVSPNEMLTFELKRLTGPNGQPAPKDLPVQTLELKTAEGSAELVKDGKPVE